MRSLPFCLSALVAAALVPACAGNSVYLHSLRATPDGRLWVGGTQGVAGYLEDGSFHQVRYPRDRSAGRYTYSAGGSVPAAQAIIHRGEPYLVTRIGEVMRWSKQGSWTRLPVELPATDGRDTAVRQTLEAPDGRILIDLTPNLLVWATARSFESGEYEVEACPRHLSRLTFLRGDLLYGLGYDDANRVPVLRRRDGPGRWPIVAHLLPREQTGELQGIIDFGSEGPAVIAYNGLLRPAGGQAELVPANTVLRTVGIPVERSSERASYFRELIHVAGGEPLIWVEGPSSGLLGRLNGQHTFWACAISYSNHPVGGVVLGTRTLLVGHQGSVSALVGDRCHTISPRQLNL